ncbi:ABC-type organic anion transporter ABCA8-like [Callospermophilus lateralis]|uniref:ABC-type organic anion transporter ABCA8-like n=1 Tax=Callospermophilus lateralis TaxID=76772 RepID=UPI00405404BE
MGVITCQLRNTQTVALVWDTGDTRLLFFCLQVICSCYELTFTHFLPFFLIEQGNMGKRKISVCQQTWTLLHKNILKKWRMKREPFMEWMNALLLLLCLYFYPIGHQVEDFSLWPPVNLGRVDSFNESKFAIEYTPVTNVTQQIMSKVATTSFMTGREVMGLSDEESIKELKADYHEEIVRVIFTNTYSYHLKFLLGQRIPISKEHRDHTAHCFEEDEDVDCYISIFWKEGFVALQAAINAAIIETTTNRSVMEELMSVTGRYMKIQPFISQGGIKTDFFIFFCIISFSPFIYYASINVTRERKTMKALMTMMGLQDSAFWLSWGLLYASFIFIMALFLALIIKSTQFFILTNFMVVFTLFLLYGLSLIALAFLMSVLVKKSFLTSLVVFLLTVFWGSLGFTALYRYLPVSLEWIFSFLSPFAFTHGMSQVRSHLMIDRKVFLSKGKLKCAGSSLFLKKKWGIGYHLSLQLNELCAREKITTLVKQHIPNAKLSAESEGKLVYTLPLEMTHSFPELYTDLDSNPGLGIENYGVSMTTLNEVFLKLEGKSALDESGVNILGEAQGERAGNTERLVEMEQILSLLMEMRKTVGGVALWGRQICAIAKVPLLKLKQERKALLSLLLILVVGFFPLFLEYILVKVHQNSYTLELSPHLYFLAPGQQPRDPLTRLLIINNTGASIDEFVCAVERQSIAVEVDAAGTRNGIDDPSYNGAIIVFRNEKKYDFLLACNTKRLNCFPVLMDVVSNGLLGMLTPSAHIQTEWSAFLRRIWDNPFEILGYTLFWLVLASSCPPYIAMSSIDDYKNSVRSLLRISGLFPSAYWLGQALVDWPLYCLFFLFMYLMDYVLNSQETVFTLVNYFIQILCAIGYAMSLIFLTYVISFTFRKGKKNSGIWSFCFYVVTVASVLICVLETSESGPAFFITFLVPQATLIGCLFLYFHLFMLIVFDDEQHTGELFLVFLIPFLHVIIFLFILRCLEWKFGKKPMGKDPFFSRRTSLTPGLGGKGSKQWGERADAKPVIVASCLRKEYAGKKKHCFSKRKSKVATRNVSFCVRKGEVLGLLGHNGAGKSTSIKVITGDTKSTAGQVLLQGSSGGDAPGFLGYCPQENVLWPNLTVREHLEVFATVKGLSRGDAELAIARLVDAFKLQDQLKAAVKTLSAGIKRKLCFMLSILGSPSVMLLDEPSTGMDPEGQQQLWQAIQAIIRNTERGAILTTHYMAEAEAVCDRVAIMVSGRLRCIGSIQHLKSKFGKDYLLEMKVKTLAQVEALHAEILRLFPQAARQERYSSLIVYKLPVEDVQPLAQAFFKLEKLKQSFHLEEDSLSQSTLEQVFLELSKEQELDVFDDELDPSVNWNLLPQEEYSMFLWKPAVAF